MSRRCDLTGTGSQTGHKVSHSNHKTLVRFMPNLQQVTLHSEALEAHVRLRVTAATLRSVEHNGASSARLSRNRPAKRLLLKRV